MKKSNRRSRRHRNPKSQEKKGQSFFSKSADAPVQTKEDTNFFQTKLKIGEPGDKYEKEADSMANAVVNQSDSKPQVQSKEISSVQRYMTLPEKDEMGTNTTNIEAERHPTHPGHVGVPEEKETQRMAEPPQEEEAAMKKEDEKEQVAAKEEEEGMVSKMGNKEEEGEGASAGMAMKKEAPLQKMGEEQEKEPTTMAKEEEEAPVAKKEEEQMQKMEAPAEKEEPTGDLQKMDEKEMKDGAGPVQQKGEVSAQGGQTASPDVAGRLDKSKGKGRPLSPRVKSEMEKGFGVDFSEVNIHTNEEAVNLNKELRAQAFTHGKDIYFNTGKYNPNTQQGKELLAHELTHVVQQNKDVKLKGGDSVQRSVEPEAQKDQRELKYQKSQLDKLLFTWDMEMEHYGRNATVFDKNEMVRKLEGWYQQFQHAEALIDQFFNGDQEQKSRLRSKYKKAVQTLLMRASLQFGVDIQVLYAYKEDCIPSWVMEE